MASFEKVIANREQVEKLLPQKQPMVMIDLLLSADDKKTVTSLTVRGDNIFCESGHLREPGLIENMAQTAAVGAGYLASLENKEPPVGFIGGIKNLVIHEFPATGKVLITEISVEYKVMGATVMTGKIFLESRIIAACELKIFLLKP
ncbi:MAG: 3-hydroxyacyl-ACP dehydratase [Bacteroidetes bacterium]|nr:3-hydroxyacyl-ACP dehydratase [Bacteroidota bacterium]